jgi:hypothetical protein
MAGPAGLGRPVTSERGQQMKSMRHFVAARRVLAASVAACGLAAGLAAGAPAAHAGPGCSWAPITLVNGWHSEQGTYGTGDPSVCLEDDGMVYLSGSVAAPSGSSFEFGTLPVWDWPTRNLYFDVYTLNSTYGVLRIDTDGTMWAYGGLGKSTGYTSLAGVSYPDPAVTQTDLPVQNGWQSADGPYNTGDPAFSISSGIVQLSGSVWRPAGTPPAGALLWNAVALPPQAFPSDNCFNPVTYTFNGGLGHLGISNNQSWPAGLLYPPGSIFPASVQYTSMAGISYPAGPVAWQSLPLLNGQDYGNGCNGPSYYTSGNVVYLDGNITVPTGFTGEIAVLPPAVRPAHWLYMIASNGNSGSATADKYVTVRIDPGGGITVITPPGGAAQWVSLSGLSFHLLS